MKNRIQPALKKLGHYKGAIDGIIGPGTRQAIKDFERSQDIFPDGVLRTKAEYNLLESVIEGNKGDLFKNLDAAAKKIKLKNISYNKFPNENKSGITDITLEAGFEWEGAYDDFKINGYYRDAAKLYFADSLCLVKHSSGNPVCMSTWSKVSAIATLTKYMKSLNDSVLERKYLKCAIIRYRYDDLYEGITTSDYTKLRSTEFIRRHFQKNRKAYVETAVNCMNTIVEKRSSNSKVVRQAINVDTGPLSSEVSDLRNKLEVTEKRFTYEREKAESRLKLLQDVKRELKDLKTSSKAEVIGLQKKQDQLKVALENAQSRNAELNTKVINVNKKLQLEEQTVRNLQNKLASLKESGNQEKLETTEAALLSQQMKVSSLQSEVDLLKSKLASEREKHTVRIDAEMRKRLEVEDASAESRKNLQIAEQELLSSQEKISSLKSEVARLASALDSDRESYQQKIGDLETEISALTQKLETAESQITSTPNKPKGFVLSEEWQQYKQWITPSQMRFCNILDEYEIARVEAANSGNQLLQNMAIKQRDKDISALLTSSRTGQSGEGFRNWVSIVQSVFAMDSVNPETGNTELAAGVILETPCGISVGTGRVLDTADAAKSEFKYLAFEGDLIFSQLASVRRGDPVLFDGSFARSEAGSSEMFITNELGEEERLEAYEKPDDAPDMFVDISYLAKL